MPTNNDGTTRSRNTKQKTAVAAALRAGDEFVSAQELHARLTSAGAAIGLSTVYRTLTAMAELGEVDTVLWNDGETAYRACSDQHHHHLVCRECGTAVEIAAEEIEKWSRSIAGAHGFSEITHTVELFGICRDCS